MTGRVTGRTLGEAVHARRLELGWTQEELAARVTDLGGEMRQSDVSRLERGKVRLPHRDRLERVAAALELPLGELLARSGWAGAEAAFRPAAAPEPREETAPGLVAERGGEPDRFAALDAPPASSVPPDRPWQGNPRLREALARAEETRARTEQILGRIAEIHGSGDRAPRRHSALPPAEDA